MIVPLLIAIGAAIGLIACDKKEEMVERDGATPRDAGTPDAPQPQPNRAAVLESSFVEPGQIRILNLDDRFFQMSPIFSTHSDAIIRTFNGRLFAVNRLGRDTVQCLDPENESTCSDEISVGAGTNPQDVVVLLDGSAYVSLYQPAEPGDVVKINLETGAIEPRLDLVPLTQDDGDRNAKASTMAEVGGLLFVALQDLQSDFSANTNGKLAVINTESGSVESAITLNCWNPIDLQYSPVTGFLHVSCAGNYNPFDAHGGIETVDPETRESVEWAYTDADFGGSPGAIALSEDSVFVVSSFFDGARGVFRSQVLRVSLEGTPGDPTLVYDGADFIQSIAWSQGTSLLLVGDRNPEAPGVVLLTEEGMKVGEPLGGEMPPSFLLAY